MGIVAKNQFDERIYIYISIPWGFRLDKKLGCDMFCHRDKDNQSSETDFCRKTNRQLL